MAFSLTDWLVIAAYLLFQPADRFLLPEQGRQFH